MSDKGAYERCIKRFQAIEADVANADKNNIYLIRTYIKLLKDEWVNYNHMESNPLKKSSPEIANLSNEIETIHYRVKGKLILMDTENSIREEGHVKPERNTSCEETLNNLLVIQQQFLKEMAVIKNDRGSEVRLPKLELPTFSGKKYEDFATFCDSFEKSIHNSTRLSNIEKFRYLNGVLKDDAQRLLQHIAITNDNYEPAWEKLCGRYDKKKFITTAFIQKFMNQPGMNSFTISKLRELCDTTDQVLRGLKAQGELAERRDPWLIFMLLQKLDFETKAAWAQESQDEDFPLIENFLKFLVKRCDAFESCCSSDQTKKSSAINKPTSSSNAITNVSTDSQCLFCQNNHFLDQCSKFSNTSVDIRREFIAENKLCFKCMRAGHRVNQCRYKKRCGVYSRYHHTLLHQPQDKLLNSQSLRSDNVNEPTSAGSAKNLNPQSKNVNGNLGDKIESRADESTSTIETNAPVKHSESSTNSNQTQMTTSNDVTDSFEFQSLLPTALVYVNDVTGNRHECRIMLDSGSMASYISEACMHRLQLPRMKADLHLRGVSGAGNATRGKTTLVMSTMSNENIEIAVKVLVLQKLSDLLPEMEFLKFNSPVFNDLKLADSRYNVPSHIDILLGIDEAYQYMREGVLIDKSLGIVAQQTIFGWVLGGKLSNVYNLKTTLQNHNTVLQLPREVEIDKTLRSFWETEEIKLNSISSEEEEYCEKYFHDTTIKSSDGRYIVRLPFKHNSPLLGSSLQMAIKRFISVERRLKGNIDMQKSYVAFIDEYKALNHMTLVKQEDQFKPNNTYYLPHHSVVKESSSTTKVRVVFDASCPTTTGVSLNEVLHIGPTIQPTLFSTLMRFRTHAICLTADVEKMYRQVLIHPDDRQFQRIIWRQSPSTKFKHYELNTVTYGIAPAPFLAIRALQQTVYDFPEISSAARSSILNDFYVDDLLTGASTVDAAVKLIDY